MKQSLACTKCEWQICPKCSAQDDIVRRTTRHEGKYPWIPTAKPKDIGNHKCRLKSFKETTFQQRRYHDCSTCTNHVESFENSKSCAVICQDCEKVHCHECNYNHITQKSIKLERTWQPKTEPITKRISQQKK